MHVRTQLEPNILCYCRRTIPSITLNQHVLSHITFYVKYYCSHTASAVFVMGSYTRVEAEESIQAGWRRSRATNALGSTLAIIASVHRHTGMLL